MILAKGRWRRAIPEQREVSYRVSKLKREDQPMEVLLVEEPHSNEGNFHDKRQKSFPNTADSILVRCSRSNFAYEQATLMGIVPLITPKPRCPASRSDVQQSQLCLPLALAAASRSPLFFPVVVFCCGSPLLSAAFIRSSSWRKMSSSASLRRVSSMTSSVLMALRPAWREKVSRSRDVFAESCQSGCRLSMYCTTSTREHLVVARL